MFPENQKKIALKLLSNSQTLDELVESTSFDKKVIEKELTKMLKMKLVKKSEDRYLLESKIANELNKRKALQEVDPYELRVQAFIEMQAIKKDLLETYLGKLEESLKKYEDITIYSISKEKSLKQGEYFSSFIDLNCTVKDLAALIKFMFFYGPTSVEIIKPEKFEIKADDLQDALMTVSQMTQNYTNYIAKLIKEKEINDLDRKISQGKIGFKP